jgi:hypothetical protein
MEPGMVGLAISRLAKALSDLEQQPKFINQPGGSSEQITSVSNAKCSFCSSDDDTLADGDYTSGHEDKNLNLGHVNKDRKPSRRSRVVNLLSCGLRGDIA